MKAGWLASLSGHRDRGRRVVVRAALQAREHGAVDGVSVPFFAKMIPPRGPLSVLCVVLVTTSAMPRRRVHAGNHEARDVRDVGTSLAPTLVAISELAKSRCADTRRARPDDLRLVSRAKARSWSKSMR